MVITLIVGDRDLFVDIGRRFGFGFGGDGLVPLALGYLCRPAEASVNDVGLAPDLGVEAAAVGQADESVLEDAFGRRVAAHLLVLVALHLNAMGRLNTGGGWAGVVGRGRGGARGGGDVVSADRGDEPFAFLVEEKVPRDGALEGAGGGVRHHLVLCSPSRQ